MPHSFFNIINSLQKSNQQISIMLSQNQLHQLNQEKSKVLLSQQLQRYHYYGLLEEYQLHPTSITNNFKYTKLNSYQHFLFKRVLHGLNVYTKEEVEKLHWDKKRRISKVWKRSQREINAWKQMICNKKVNDYFSRTFKGRIIEHIISFPATEVLEDYNNKLSFKELNIEYEDVIYLFMSKGLLPRNYLTLKSNNQQALKA
tara:strand:+ start:1132 stop:1734 length:603 start_codon:yes stop_codon:yes gene_type:complete